MPRRKRPGHKPSSVSSNDETASPSSSSPSATTTAATTSAHTTFEAAFDMSPSPISPISSPRSIRNSLRQSNSPRAARDNDQNDADGSRQREGPERPPPNESDGMNRVATAEELTTTTRQLSGPTGAELWVHRVLATHHRTLQTLGLERADFPNTRLSMKQLEVLLGPVIALCNMMTPDQFGIRAPTPHVARSMNEVHYWKLWESDTIDMGIFFMPPNSVIPLHNHPGMSVVSRILYGCANVTSYDLIASESLNEGAKQTEDGMTVMEQNIKWARVSREGDYVGESTMWLDPRRFNLHQIQANSDIGCALLDIMIPPYDNADRDCHHFRILEERYDQAKKERMVKMLESITADNHNEPTGGSLSTGTTTKTTNSTPVVSAPSSPTNASSAASASSC